jgi:NAD(P) transhydrogenase subunit alpha
MWVGIPAESHPGERRVAGTSDTVRKLKNMGFMVRVEQGAGEEARFFDGAYQEAGAELADAATVWSSDLLLKVRPPSSTEVEQLKSGSMLISLIYPAQNQALLEQIAARGASLIALDQIPRISRAQKMDVLSSMANISGYRAVLEAASQYGGFFSGQITAAGKSRPAQVLIIGAGVAGLAAIGAARGLGAEVRAFDVRSASREQVESLGARFLTVEIQEEGEAAGGYAKEMSKAFIEAELALFAAQAKEVDIIITTALIPGKKAPILLDEALVKSMKPGSVIVDLASEQGGNCCLTRPNEVHREHGVTIIGYTDLPSRLPAHASQFLGNNLCHLLSDMGGCGGWKIDLDDDVIYQALVVQSGTIRFPVAPRPQAAEKKTEPTAAKAAPKEVLKAADPAPLVTQSPSSPPAKKSGHGHKKGGSRGGGMLGAITAVALTAAGIWAPPEFVQHFTVFILACFIGWQVVWNVTPALHTPLMSVTNAISGIILVGGMISAGAGSIGIGAILGAIAVLVASINIAGGFLVTHRMLAMFRKEGS